MAVRSICVHGLLAVAVAVASACGGDGGASRLEVEVSFSDEATQMMTNSLHVWVVHPSDDPDATCNGLVSHTVAPYADVFEVIADEVFLQPDEPSPVLEEVPGGNALVYVEAVGFVGDTLLAGCVPASLNGGTVQVTVNLTTPGAFDCTDPATPNGSPCDDGLLCTVGESCSAGSCGGGTQRDCSYVADDCNGESCDEALGCVAVPLPNGTACDDALYCSNGEVCMDGVCIGAERDCTSVEDQCNNSICNESIDSCLADPVVNGTGCDDGLFCTEVDTCSFGFCDGTVRDCSGVEDQCNASTCNETTDSCDPVPLTGPLCDDTDVCTMDEACSAGVCTGGVVTDGDGDGFPLAGCGGGGPEDCDDTRDYVNPDATEGPALDATCSDGLDNDCDTLIDDADTADCT